MLIKLRRSPTNHPLHSTLGMTCVSCVTITHQVVCDEAHRLKSVSGNKTIDSLLGLECSRRVLLTGTPVQNNLQVGTVVDNRMLLCLTQLCRHSPLYHVVLSSIWPCVCCDLLCSWLQQAKGCRIIHSEDCMSIAMDGLQTQ